MPIASGASVKARGKKTSVWLPERLIRATKARADLEGRAASLVVEEAIRRYLADAPRHGERAAG